jgi:hypothetical protein
MQPNNASIPPVAESPRANGHSTAHDIFVLSDEQILEIDPQPQDVEISTGAPSVLQHASVAPASSPAVPPDAAPNNTSQQRVPDDSPSTQSPHSSTEHGSRNTEHVQPPAWLAAQMKDAWNGADARALWDRVQATETEAAAYREVFAKPEDARAIKALYPGGAPQAQAAAERARLLDDIDRAYFGAQGSTPEQSRTARSQLAAMMLREDPAAFREMVFEGLRALEAADGRGSTRSIADAFGRASQLNTSPVGARLVYTEPRSASPAATGADTSTGGASPSPTAQVAQPFLAVRSTNEAQARMPAPPEHLNAYAAFEKAANADLEKSVGSAIERALHQALPTLGATDVAARFSASPSSAGAQQVAPLQARLSEAIREDVERALQGDRQLGEQVAQILAGRRFDEQTRAQVVRLIHDRALQLVPGAARRALSDWTQATLAAHRSRTARSEASASRREVPAAAPVPRDLHTSNQNAAQNAANRTARNDSQPASRGRVNYNKLSDEQILNL